MSFERLGASHFAAAMETAFEFPFDYVDGSESLSLRFAKLRTTYKTYQRAVDAGKWSWMRGDPYAIADWLKIFTPIEDDAWCEIRSYGLPMWPQFPVDKFFVDFGNPVKKVALECDGRDFHDAKKDAERDAVLLSHGWRVLRVTGSQCYGTRTMVPPWIKQDRGEDVDAYYEMQYERGTIHEAITELRRIFGRIQPEYA